MADAAKAGTETQQGEDVELQTSIESDEDFDELKDESGKPLPWNHVKRVRKIYKDAEAGRRATTVLKELGLKASDLPTIVAEYNDFKEAYEEWQERKEAGDTTRSEDKQMTDADKEAQKFVAVLKKLGVKFTDPNEKDPKETAASERKDQVLTAAHDRMIQLVEDAGYDLDKMDSKARSKFLRHIDFLLSEEIEGDEDALKDFLKGSLRPVEKYTKEVLKNLTVKPTQKPKGSGINNLPPRVGRSGVPGESTPKPDSKPPKNVREAAAQMVDEMRAAKGRNSEE